MSFKMTGRSWLQSVRVASAMGLVHSHPSPNLAKSRASLSTTGDAIVMRRSILAKTGFYIDGRDMADALGGPLVAEIRSRTGM